MFTSSREAAVRREPVPDQNKMYRYKVFSHDETVDQSQVTTRRASGVKIEAVVLEVMKNTGHIWPRAMERYTETVQASSTFSFSLSLSLSCHRPFKLNTPGSFMAPCSWFITCEPVKGREHLRYHSNTKLMGYNIKVSNLAESKRSKGHDHEMYFINITLWWQF